MPAIELPYTPRECFDSFHAAYSEGQQNAVLCVHRRGGKTVSSLNEMIKRALLFPRDDGRYAYIAPFAGQAKDIAWDYLLRYTAAIPNITVNRTELHVTLPNGSRIRIYGADNYEALRGIYLDGLIIDEPEDMDKDAWESVLRYCILDRGGWVVWIGTIKGAKGLYRLYCDKADDPSYFRLYLRASDSRLFPPHVLESLEKENPAKYAREMELDPYAETKGSIYGVAIAKAREESRVTDFPAEPTVPLYTFWDVGFSDYNPVWLLQFHGREILVLDYFCSKGKEPAFYAAKVKEWERQYKVRVAKNYLPHDAAAVQRNGLSYVKRLHDAGIPSWEIQVVPRTSDVWDGINVLRPLLGRMHFHKTNCSRPWREEDDEMPSGLDCVEFYHTKETNKNGIISDQPAHDAYSHGADALRTFAEAWDRGLIEGTSVSARESTRPFGGQRYAQDRTRQRQRAVPFGGGYM